MSQDNSPKTPPPSKQADGDQGTRSGRPNSQDPPSHTTEHESGYGGNGGEPKSAGA